MRCVNLLSYMIVPLLTIPLFSQEPVDLLAYDLEDLSQISISDSIVTLTPADPKSLPASVTTITQTQIMQSGARSLDELLEIYVPGFAYMYKTEGNQMGMRGIISDRNNKILLLVNGQKMNVMARDGGAITERWFPLLGDIRRITVINGPGSAVYGAGAIAGVINIETFDGSEREGMDVSIKGGVGENFGALEWRYFHTFENDMTLFAYGGIDHYEGASESNAPHKLSFDVQNVSVKDHSADIVANEPFPYKTTRDNGAFNDKARYKYHVQLSGENFTLWSRYTRSGLAIPTLQGFYRTLHPDKLQDTGAMNQQWSSVGEYTWELSSGWELSGKLSYMVSDIYIVMTENETPHKNWREENFGTKVQANYVSEDERDSMALGVAYEHTDFGDRPSIGDELVSYVGSGFEEGTAWSSSMVSFFGEYQKHVGENWVLFSGLRADKHTYSDWMYSPRFSAIYAPDASRVFKFIYNRSVRHSDDVDLYAYYLDTGERGDVETIDNFEIAFDYYPNSKWDLHLSAYYNQHDVVAYNDAEKKTANIGEVDFYGIEAIVNYHHRKWEVSLSHNYTKLYDFTLQSPDIIRQNISAEPKGYGDDLANWYDHMTKVSVNYKVSEQLQWNSSLRIFWDMPGAVDMADYNMDHFADNVAELLRLPLYTENTRAFEESIFLNVGMTYHYNDQLTLSMYGYDLLGLFDETLNKRNYFQRTSHYREASPSLSMQISYQFE